MTDLPIHLATLRYDHMLALSTGRSASRASRPACLDAMLVTANNAQPTPRDVTTTDHYVTTPDGDAILLRWYDNDAATDRPGPAVLYLHGGGMILGSVDIFDGPVARYASRSGVPMLSVEYRLGPEHPCPAPAEDAYTALTWLAEQADELGVDPAHLGDGRQRRRRCGAAALAIWPVTAVDPRSPDR